MRTLKTTVAAFINDNCPTMGAALAYYTLFALPSLLLVVIGVAGLLLGPDQVESKIQSALQQVIGGGAGGQLSTMARHARAGSGSGVPATAFGVLALLYGASTAFVQLQSALNAIWRIEPDPNQSGIAHFVKDRLFSFLLVIGIAILFLASLALSAVLSSAGGTFTSWLPPEISQTALHTLEAVVSFIVFVFLFAGLFKILPDADLDWRQVRVGAIVTALLFTIGKSLIALYLGHSGAASAYGEAGSLVLIVLWVYYSSLIILLGAEFTRVWSEAHVGPIKPDRGAIRTQSPRLAIRKPG
jgi:membrane protein